MVPINLYHFYHADALHSIRDRAALRRHHFNLPQLRDDLLGRVTLPGMIHLKISVHPSSAGGRV